MKVACLLTDSIYTLAVAARGNTGNDVLALGFAGIGEATGGDGMAGAGSAGRGGVSEMSIGTEIGVSRIDAGTGTGVGTSGRAPPASAVLASDPGAYLSPDFADSWLVLRIGGVWRFCNTSKEGRSRNFDRSRTISSGTGLLWKKRFWASKRALISAKMVSILADIIHTYVS